MTPLRPLFLAILALVASHLSATGHTFTVTIWDYWGIPEGSTSISVSDGLGWVDATLQEIQGDPTGEFDDNGIEILTNFRHIYQASVPEVWATEHRGIAFHLPGHGWTWFCPMIAANGNHDIDLSYSRRTYPNPNLNTTTSGNRVLLGQWWPRESGDPFVAPPSVARLITWDNNNRYWPCVGADFISTTGHTFWRWMHPEGEDNVVAMELDYLHRLTLRSRTNPANTLMLDPELGRITLNGMPFVTADNAVAQLSSAFVSRSAAGVNLARGGGTLRAGSGLPPQVLLGGANDARTSDNGTDHTQGVLIVGSAANPGTNGLRILDDGTVLIQPSGDLEMAVEFRGGPRP